MKILQVNKYYHPTIGGVETFVKQISEGLVETYSWQADVLTCHAEAGKATQIETINGVKVYRTRSFGSVLSMPLSVSFFIWFRKLASQYDVILIHHPFPLGFLAYWMFGKNKPLVVWYFADIVRQKFTGALIKPLIHWVLGAARKIIIYSQAVATSSTILPRYQDKLAVIPYGIDFDHYQVTPEVSQLTEKIKEKHSGPLLLSVGRLVSYKGYDILINAMEGVDARLLIVGNGPLQSQLQAQIRNKKLEDKVFVLDFVPDLRPYYHAADIFVLPSVTNAETLAIVQLEALATSTPVINTNLPTAVPEVSLHNLTGLTVPVRDEIALREAIVKLLDDQDLRNQFSQAALQRAKDVYSKEVFTQKLMETFTSL